MKIPVLIGLLVAVMVVGCDKKDQSSSSGSSGASSVLTAPADYVGAAAKAQQVAVKTVDTAALQNAIQMFAGEQGRSPKTLNELVEKKYLPAIPQAPKGMKIEYDPNLGTVKIVRQ